MPELLKLNAPKIHDWFYLTASYIKVEDVFDSFFEFVQDFDDSDGISRQINKMNVPAERPDHLVDMAIKGFFIQRLSTFMIKRRFNKLIFHYKIGWRLEERHIHLSFKYFQLCRLIIYFS